jgi:hypothetical protein
MTADRYDFTFSRRDTPEVLHFVGPHKYRGRGEDRVRAAPAVSQAMCIKKCAHEHTGSAENTPASPTQWLYGLYVVVLVTGFVATIAFGSFRFRELDASTGASDPHDFAVRLRHARQS